MKLWLIVYVGTEIGGSWGPLPYGIEECRDRATLMNSETQAIAETGKNSVGEVIPSKNVDQIKTLRFECEFRQSRPEITHRAAGAR